jgi:hypothetical protein
MASTPTLPVDFVDLLAAFADAQVRYLVIGGYAVGFHDRPRATKDLDLLIADDPDNVERACLALSNFGAAADIVEALRQAGADEVVWFGIPPVRVDLLKSAPGVDFDHAHARRVMMKANDVLIPVVALEDLIRMKVAAGRDQDRADVRRLERRRPPK